MPESPAMQTPPPSVARASPERLEDLFSPSEAPGSIPAAQEFVAPHDEEQPEVQHGEQLAKAEETGTVLVSGDAQEDKPSSERAITKYAELKQLDRSQVTLEDVSHVHFNCFPTMKIRVVVQYSH